ncbi:mediator of RNA polymerase II transcription subunit 22-like isoform X2 [Acropora millepora]|nr:mediator of RNA polymerase II transcription subunit 22-like isoform X2 [Acropora millepora]XP_044174404.1 mediator of RNA polymerase II transcription subunit 22-like isoform X2 [Acropora millepora]XP_044174409.1 mediator of RNA polymerase II transcription subunit 22-like isoform X2 [Acropora millepora]
MSQPSRILPQSNETLLKSYTKRLKDDVKSILDNFTEIVKSSKVESETQVARLTQSAQDQYEMNVRAANIVRAGESLMKLVSDMKEFLILNDFPSVNTSISERSNALQEINNVTDQQLLTLKQELAVNLFELEQSYYSSSFR